MTVWEWRQWDIYLTQVAAISCSGRRRLAHQWGSSKGYLSQVDIPLAPLPGGGIIGGGSLSVSRYSMHRNEAIAFVRYFTGYRQQLSRWKALLSFPTIPAVYRVPELKNGTQPLAAIRDAILGGMFARPSAIAARNYDVLSHAYFMAVHSVLTHEKSARQAMAELENELARLPGLHPERLRASLARLGSYGFGNRGACRLVCNRVLPIRFDFDAAVRSSK